MLYKYIQHDNLFLSLRLFIAFVLQFVRPERLFPIKSPVIPLTVMNPVFSEQPLKTAIFPSHQREFPLVTDAPLIHCKLSFVLVEYS